MEKGGITQAVFCEVHALSVQGYFMKAASPLSGRCYYRGYDRGHDRDRDREGTGMREAGILEQTGQCPPCKLHPSRAFAEEGGADAKQGGPLFDGDLVIAAHPHGEMRQSMRIFEPLAGAVAELPQQRKVAAGPPLVAWRPYRHQPK